MPSDQHYVFLCSYTHTHKTKNVTIDWSKKKGSTTTHVLFNPIYTCMYQPYLPEYKSHWSTVCTSHICRSISHTGVLYVPAISAGVQVTLEYCMYQPYLPEYKSHWSTVCTSHICRSISHTGVLYVPAISAGVQVTLEYCMYQPYLPEYKSHWSTVCTSHICRSISHTGVLYVPAISAGV